MSKIKYTLAMLATSPFALLAQETGGSTDATAATMVESITEGAETALTGMLDTVAPVIVTIVIAGLAIWGGITLVGVIKRAFNAGKGR